MEAFISRLNSRMNEYDNWRETEELYKISKKNEEKKPTKSCFANARFFSSITKDMLPPLRITNSDILNDIKKIMLAEKNTDSNCISVFDIVQLLKKIHIEDDKQNNYCIKSVNSIFHINIYQNHVRIFVNLENAWSSEFSLCSSSYDNKYYLECASPDVNEILENKEEEIFKKIFVKISDCPKWSQPILYEMRQKQLTEVQKIEDSNIQIRKRKKD